MLLTTMVHIELNDTQDVKNIQSLIQSAPSIPHLKYKIWDILKMLDDDGRYVDDKIDIRILGESEYVLVIHHLLDNNMVYLGIESINDVINKLVDLGYIEESKLLEHNNVIDTLRAKGRWVKYIPDSDCIHIGVYINNTDKDKKDD